MLALRRRAATSHGEIAWEAFGEGPPVVLVHGTPSRALVWRAVAERLAERHAVYLFDLLGFGDSERAVEQDVSLVAHGQVLAELVAGWGIERPALVGHDIGRAVVLRAHLLEGVAGRTVSGSTCATSCASTRRTRPRSSRCSDRSACRCSSCGERRTRGCRWR